MKKITLGVKLMNLKSICFSYALQSGIFYYFYFYFYFFFDTLLSLLVVEKVYTYRNSIWRDAVGNNLIYLVFWEFIP